MFRLSRYRGVALVVAAILLALGLLDLSLTAAVGFTGRFLPNREEPQDESAFTLAGGRISEVLSLALGEAGIGTETPLGVVLGLSSMRYAVDFGILAENDGLPLRWLNLGGWGRSINRICAYLRTALLERSEAEHCRDLHESLYVGWARLWN